MGILMCSHLSMGLLRQKSFMSMPMNLASGVDNTWLKRIFAVGRSAVLVLTPPGQSTLSPSTVNLTLLGLAFIGPSETTSLRQVAFLPAGI